MPEKNFYEKLRNNWLVILINIFFLFLLHIYIPNQGGDGIAFPLNILVWGFISFLSLIICFITISKKVVIPTNFWCLVVGMVLLTLPLIWSSPEGRNDAYLRIGGGWAGLLVYFAICQAELTDQQKTYVLWGVFGGAVLETLFSLLQLVASGSDVRPVGIFQQVNVLASFLATGLSVSFILFCSTRAKYWIIILAAGQIMISAVLVILSSRIGWLSGCVAYLLFLIFCLISRRRLTTTCRFTALLSPLCGLFIGLGFIYATKHHWIAFDYVLIAKEASTKLRMVVLAATWEMIKENPLSGIGYGEFAYHLVRLLPSILAKDAWRISHPHNEILYWWVEGGMLALWGMGFIFWSYIRSINTKKYRVNILWFYVSIPILLHSLTEFPFYLSVSHYFLLLLFYAFMASNSIIIRDMRAVLSVKIVGSVVFLFLLVCCVFAMQANYRLTEFEQSGMKESNILNNIYFPQLQWQRYQFDTQVSNLLRFNTTRDRQLLRDFECWAAGYSLIHNDKNVCLTRVKIAQYFKQNDKARILKAECSYIYP